MSKKRQDMGREIECTWGKCFYWGPWVEYVGVPRLKLDWFIQTKKKVGFWLTTQGSYIKRVQEEGTGSQETVDKKGCWGSHTKSVHLLVSLQTVAWDLCLCEGLPVDESPLSMLVQKIVDACRGSNSGCRGSRAMEELSDSVVKALGLRKLVGSLFRAVITNHYLLGGLEQQVFTLSGDQKSERKMSVDEFL